MITASVGRLALLCLTVVVASCDEVVVDRLPPPASSAPTAESSTPRPESTPVRVVLDAAADAALVAHGAELVTCDQRAAPVYERYGVRAHLV